MSGQSTDDTDRRDPEEMEHEELRSEWEDTVERLRNPPASHRQENYLWERRRALWNEIKSRCNDEPPECPECEHRGWAQEMGGPKYCKGCDFHPTLQERELIQAIDEYWETVLSGLQEESQ
jgi:transcription elongation factor Elf1